MWKNVIFERARFNRRSQLEGESVEEYLTALYSLVEACEYGNLSDDLLRDRIVVGIQDVSLSERMELDATLTLEKAKKMVRQKEAVTLQGQQLRGDGTKGSPLLIEPVGSRRPTRSRQPLVQTLLTKADEVDHLQIPVQAPVPVSAHAVATVDMLEGTGVLHWRPSAIAVIGEDTIALGASPRQ